MNLAKTWCVVGVSILSASFVYADPRNHEPFNTLVVCKSGKKVGLGSSATGTFVDEDFLPFSFYGGFNNGVPGDAINVLRQIWVSDTVNHKIYRFAADINYPPPFYGEVQST